MNEQLQVELTKIITNINQGAESVWGFVNEQTPDVISQLLLFYGIYNAILFIVPILGLCICTPLFIKNLNDADWETSEFTSPCGYAVFFGVLSFICSLMLLFGINLTWLKIWIAPKVWLLEYVSNMVK